MNEDLEHHARPVIIITTLVKVALYRMAMSFKKPPYEETVRTYIPFSQALHKFRFFVCDDSHSQRHAAT